MSKMSKVVDDRPKGRWLAFWLVLGHVVVGVIDCGIIRYYRYHGPTTHAFVGLVFGQTSLVGLWGGLGTTNWKVRLVGVLVGLIYLSGVLGVGVDQFGGYLVLMVMFAGLSVAGLLMIGRCFGLRIHATGVDVADTSAQFSIRQLMLLTVLVACVTTIAKVLTPHVDPGTYLAMLFLITIPFGFLGLAAIWAILVTEHPKLGILAVLLLAPLLGIGVKMIMSGPINDTRYWLAATMTEASVLIVSLYIIRRGGFRIRRKRKGREAFVGAELHEEDKCGTLGS